MSTSNPLSRFSLGGPGHADWMYDAAPDRIAALATFLAESGSARVNGKPVFAT